MIFSFFIVSVNGAEKPVSKDQESIRKITKEQPFLEYSLYDVCQRLDRVIQMLEKIIDQNEKTIDILKKESKKSEKK